MKRFIFNSSEDYLALIIRRIWWLLVPLLLLSLSLVAITFHLPDVYVSETLILVEPRDIPEDFVRDLITVETEERLDTVKQTVLSRTNLLRIIDEFNDGLASLGALTDGQKVAKLRDWVKIETETRRGRAALLRIRFQHRNPEVAQKITSRFASLLIEYDNRTREEQVFGTTQFIESELESVSAELQRVEHALAEVKKRHRHELPDQLDTNLRTLDLLHTQLMSNTESLDRSIGLRLDLERQISETDPLLIEEIGVRAPNSAASQPPSLVVEYRQKQRLLNELSSRYTEKHPDMRRLKMELNRLKKEIPPADLLGIEQAGDLETGTISRPNPVYQNLTTQLPEMKREIKIREREREWIQSEIEKYTQRVQRAPQREQEMAGILRSHAELTKQYDDLKDKLVEGRLAENLESRQRGTQFVIVDPANYPESPSKPNRLLILLLGLFLSLSAGTGIAFAADLVDQKLWTYAEVEELLGTAVLAEIPEIVVEEDVENNKRRRRKKLVLLFAIALTLSGFIYYVYFVNLELRSHDPAGDSCTSESERESHGGGQDRCQCRGTNRNRS